VTLNLTTLGLGLLNGYGPSISYQVCQYRIFLMRYVKKEFNY